MPFLFSSPEFYLGAISSISINRTWTILTTVDFSMVLFNLSNPIFRLSLVGFDFWTAPPLVKYTTLLGHHTLPQDWASWTCIWICSSRDQLHPKGNFHSRSESLPGFSIGLWLLTVVEVRFLGFSLLLCHSSLKFRNFGKSFKLCHCKMGVTSVPIS